jgi:LysM repeat protein
MSDSRHLPGRITWRPSTPLVPKEASVYHLLPRGITRSPAHQSLGQRKNAGLRHRFPVGRLLVRVLRAKILDQGLRASIVALALGGAMARPTFAAPTVTYQVRPGDTLSSIARQFNTSVSNLATANTLPSPNFIVAGQILTVSVAAPATAPAPEISAPSSAHCPSFAIDDNGDVVRALAPCPPAVPPAPAILPAPYHSQFDGSIYAETNCGPTALSIALGALHISVDQISLRRLANVQMGTSDPNSGTTWEALAYAAQASGIKVTGLYQGQGRVYRNWSIDDLKNQLAQGHPVLLLVRYQDLPGNAQSPLRSDHYVVALGFDQTGNLVYDDPAYYNGAGAGRVMSLDALNRAWSNTSVGLVRTAMALSA